MQETSSVFSTELYSSFQVSFRYMMVSSSAPTAPRAAPSVGVASPLMIVPSDAREAP